MGTDLLVKLWIIVFVKSGDKHGWLTETVLGYQVDFEDYSWYKVFIQHVIINFFAIISGVVLVTRQVDLEREEDEAPPSLERRMSVLYQAQQVKFVRKRFQEIR